MSRFVASAFIIAPIIAAPLLVGLCGTAFAWGAKAAAPAPKVIACAPTPTMLVDDDEGRYVAAIFLCFRDDSVVTYVSHPLTPEQIAKLTPAPAAKPEGLSWDRPECEYYRPEAQDKFCKRVKARKNGDAAKR